MSTTADHRTRHAVVRSALGELLLTGTGDSLTGVYFEGHRHPSAPQHLGPRVEVGDDPLLLRAATQLGEYLAGARTVFDLPLAARGEPFQQRVWHRLRQIGYGQRATYGAIAEELGGRDLARAVGAAVGRNPISIIVPCHRVVGRNGSLTGYAGGLDRKARLLALEANDVLF